MKWQVAILVLILLLVVVFAAVNWPLFTAPSSLNLVFSEVEAPIGLVMLGVVAVLTALYLLFVAGMRASTLVETRRYAREMQRARELADAAESSRFTELRQFLDQELGGLRDLVHVEAESTREGVTKAEETVAAAVDQSHNSLVANLGEMDSRLGGAPAGGTPHIEPPVEEPPEAPSE